MQVFLSELREQLKAYGIAQKDVADETARLSMNRGKGYTYDHVRRVLTGAANCPEIVSLAVFLLEQRVAALNDYQPDLEEAYAYQVGLCKQINLQRQARINQPAA